MRLLRITLIILGASAVAVLGYMLFDQMMNGSINLGMPTSVEYDDTANETMTTEETSEVDEAVLEDTEDVSNDNSLNTLELELDETVILEEDFSDL